MENGSWKHAALFLGFPKKHVEWIESWNVFHCLEMEWEWEKRDSCSIPQLNTEGHPAGVFTYTCTSTGTVYRVRGLHVGPFSFTPSCRQLHSIFRGKRDSEIR